MDHRDSGDALPPALQRITAATVPLSYLLYLPPGYDDTRPERWPLVLSLHGGGERGDDLRRVTRHGIPKLIAAGRSFPFILVAPQCPAEEWWSPVPLGVLLDDVMGTYAVDVDRVYVTGYSMGGFATWALALAFPERFAAIVPICGWGDTTRVAAIARLPIWTFHWANDARVPLSRSEEMVAALHACGSDARLTVYPHARHDAWTETYANPDVYTWLLGHSRCHEGQP